VYSLSNQLKLLLHQIAHYKIAKIQISLLKLQNILRLLMEQEEELKILSL